MANVKVAGVDVPEECFASDTFRAYQDGAAIAAYSDAKNWASGHIPDDHPALMGKCHEPMTETGCREALLREYTQRNMEANCDVTPPQPPVDPDDPCARKSLQNCYLDYYDSSLPCTSSRNVMAAQIVLKANGYYRGPLTGVWDRDSQIAYDKHMREGRPSPFADCQGPVPYYTEPSPPSPPEPPGPPQPPDPKPPGYVPASEHTASSIGAGMLAFVAVAAVFGAIAVFSSIDDD